MRHWATQFQKMRELGLKVPVPWGHNSRAIPLDPNDPDESQFLSSRYNAGYVEALAVTPDGRLVADQECPGLETDANGNVVAWTRLNDGREVKTAIGEVSLGIAKKFTDGKGRIWNDVITHIAVTPHPVWAGQDGFQALGGLDGRVEGLVVLSLAGGSSAMDDKDILDDDLVNDDGGNAPEPPPPGESAGSGAVTMENLLPALADHGIVLPDGTDEGNFVERLFVAITALQGKLTPAGGAAPQDDPNANPMGGPGGAGVTEQEPDAILMSLMSRITNANEKAALQRTLDERKAHRRETQEKRAAKVRKQIERHINAGIPRAVIAKHFSDPETIHLSLLEKSPQDLVVMHAKLSLLKDVKPFLSGSLTRKLANAIEVPNPHDRTVVHRSDEQASVTDRMAKSVGC